MTKRKPTPPVDGDANDAKPDVFDLWLNRSLHELYDNIAQEPIPDELLKLIKEGPAN